MTKKLVLSYGHGSNTFDDSGSKGLIIDGRAYEEHTHNATVGEKVRKIVEAHGIDVLVVQPPFAKDVPLINRTDKANSWGADLYYSIHSNAAKPDVKGYCAFYWVTSAAGKAIALDYAKYAKAEGFPLYHDGAYASVKGTWNDFHELRETNMAAVLTENGFMTNKEDFKRVFFNEDGSFDKEARVHAKTILEFFKVSYDPKKGQPEPVRKPANVIDSNDIYRVQVGAYKSKANAESLVTKLKKDGYPAIVVKGGN